MECGSDIDEERAKTAHDSESSEQGTEEPLDDQYALRNTIMFPSANLSIYQVLSMVMAIVLRYNLSDEIHQAIINLIKILAGPHYKYINTSKYILNKIFNPVGKAVNYVFYCTACNIILTDPIPIDKNIKTKVTCKKCNNVYQTSKKEGNFFVTVDLKDQLTTILSNNKIQEEINNNIKSRYENRIEGTITDVCDSSRYLNDDSTQSKNDEDNVVLTLNVNLDGAPLFKSGKNSFWPMQCVINEIPQKIRHKFMLLAGLWYTAVEPKPKFMNLYLSTLINQVKLLSTKGLKIVTENGRVITYFLKIFSFPVDSVARPVLQNRLQFNGFFGCSWCYQKGVFNAGSMKYPLNSDSPRLRNHNSYLSDVQKYKRDVKKLPKTKKNEKYTVHGVKGSSVLSSLPGFDCVWGFPHDYMHGVLLGVARQLWNRWSKKFLSADQKKIINARLINIHPINEIHRTPRILLKKSSWKATEWRSWLLFYSVPVLNGILRQDLLDSYKLLVKSIFKLLSPNMSEDELVNCEIDLLQFVYDCQNLYGTSFMTFNVHSLLHIVESVRMNGPSWATSTYAFENNIYNLKGKVTGPNGVLGQMATRTLRYNNFHGIINDEFDELCRGFCQNMIDGRQKENVSHSIRTMDGAILMDNMTLPFLKNNVFYSRCLYKNKMYHGQVYTKAKKTNNAFVSLNDGRMAQIIRFSVEENITFMEVNILDVEIVDSFEHIWKIQHRRPETLKLSMSMIQNKMIYISIKALSEHENNVNYLTKRPNDFEVQ